MGGLGVGPEENHTGLLVAYLRKKRRISIAALAECIRQQREFHWIEDKHVADWEMGMADVPAALFDLISKKLRCEPEELYRASRLFRGRDEFYPPTPQ